MKPASLIDPADRIRIESAVIEAERSTAGEIVVAVVEECDEYGSAGWRCGVVVALMTFAGLGVALPALPLWAYLGAQVAGLLLGHGLCRIDFVRRHFISESLIEARVAERARSAFNEYGLRRTQGGTGILIFVTLLERRVVVLADHGIHAAVGSDRVWSEAVQKAIEGLRSGQAAQGLIDAVQCCGRTLAEHVPAEERDVDELPNAVVLAS